MQVILTTDASLRLAFGTAVLVLEGGGARRDRLLLIIYALGHTTTDILHRRQTLNFFEAGRSRTSAGYEIRLVFGSVRTHVRVEGLLDGFRWSGERFILPPWRQRDLLPIYHVYLISRLNRKPTLITFEIH